jgi:hypothetical protein
MRTSLVRALAAVFVCAAAGSAFAQTPPAEHEAVRQEIERLREEFNQLRQRYDERLSALETRLSALDAQMPVPPAPVGGGALPVYGNVTALSKIFNPDIAVIGNFIGAAGKHPQDPRPSLDLREVEASLQAVVDPYARADFFFGFSGEGVEIEEGYVTFPTLPGGLLGRAGRFRSAIGRVNAMHAHNLPWIDRPLVTRNLLEGDEGIAAAGVSAARLVPNPWVFLEVTGELSAAGSSDLGYLARARGYRDLTDSTNVDLGFSFFSGAASSDVIDASTSTRIVSLDGTFRYRPLRRAIYRRLLARSELIWRREDPTVASVFGAYAGAEYQIARRWFTGARWDYSERTFDPRASDTGASWMLTFWPSEFSQMRGQYRRTRYAEGRTAHDLLLQVLISIGAHGAHPF